MTYRRHLAPNHSLNTPATIDRTADHAAWERRLAASGPMRLEAGTGSLFHVPTYSRADATGWAVLTQFAWAAKQQTMGMRPSGSLLTGTWQPAMIPWNPAWHWPATSQPTDRTIIIVDHTSGQTWEMWKVMDDHGGHGDHIAHLPNWFAAKWAQDRGLPIVTVADAQVWSSIWTRLDRPGRIGIRGCGLDKPAGIVRLEELERHAADGTPIGHAINMTISNTRVGTEFRPPATRAELPTLAHGQLGGVVTTVRPDTDTLPSGTRFVLRGALMDLAPSLALAATGPAHTAMTAIIGALETHGIIATETGGYGTGIETDWSPSTADRWAKLGITSAAPDQPHQRFLATLATTPGIWKLAATAGGAA